MGADLPPPEWQILARESLAFRSCMGSGEARRSLSCSQHRLVDRAAVGALSTEVVCQPDTPPSWCGFRRWLSRGGKIEANVWLMTCVRRLNGQTTTQSDASRSTECMLLILTIWYRRWKWCMWLCLLWKCRLLWRCQQG